MNNQKTLNEFERYRLGYRFLGGRWLIVSDPYIPPAESDTFFTVGEGQVQLFCLRDNPYDYRFDIYLSGKIITGQGSFSVNGEISDLNHPYRNLFVRKDSEIEVTNNLTISKGRSVIDGVINLTQMSSLICSDSANVTFTENSVLNLPKDSFFFVNTNAIVYIYGQLNMDYSIAHSVFENPNIIIDPSAFVKVTGLPDNLNKNTLTDFYESFKTKNLALNTINEDTSNDGGTIVQYQVFNADPSINAVSANLICKSGNYFLGDFKLPFTGIAQELRKNERSFANLKIEEDAVLYINDQFGYYPECYIGAVPENSKTSANCLVEGIVFLNGENSSFILDRNGKLVINSYFEISNKGKLKCSNSNQVTLEINGTLVIDSLDNLEGFSKENIEFGPDGKLIVKNINTDPIVLKIPNGIEESKLYKLFKENLTHIEFTINENSGIEIDQNFEVFYRDLKNWYGNYSFERAIQYGLLKWNGGYLKFKQSVIPWINEYSDLYDLIQIFNSSGSTNKEKLQSIINNFIRAKVNKIKIIFEANIGDREIVLELKEPEIKNVFYSYQDENYVIECSYPNTLFLKNNLDQITGYKISDHSKLKKSLLSENTSFLI